MSHPALNLIAELWPSWRPTAAIDRLWTAALAGRDTDLVLAAVMVHAERSTWPPALADLLRYLDVNHIDRAAQALDAIDTYQAVMSRLCGDTSDGAYRERQTAMDDIPEAAVELALTLWGSKWRDGPGLSPTDRRSFLEHYGATVRREETLVDLDRARKLLGAVQERRAIGE